MVEELCSKERHNMHSSHNNPMVCKFKRMGWVGHVALIGKMGHNIKFSPENLKGLYHFRSLGVD
jgi:hypothetical protein